MTAPTQPMITVTSVTVQSNNAPTLIRAGETVSDATTQTAVLSGGGQLVPASDPICSAAAAIVLTMRGTASQGGRGANDDVCEKIMLAASAAYAASLSTGGEQTGVTPLRIVRVATAGALPAGTYVSATQTFTVTATGTLTVDGKVLNPGDVILVKNQVAGLQNGIYKVLTSAVGTQASIQRTADMDASSDFQPGMLVGTSPEGTANPSAVFQLDTAAPITLDTTATTWTQVASGVTLAGLGVQSGRTTLALGVSPAIAANIDASSRIVATHANLNASTAVGFLFAEDADRVNGTPGSFKIRALDATHNAVAGDLADVDWHVIG
jgi:hypothetical protein